MERAHTTYYGRYGIYYVSNNMDLLLASYPDAWTICRLFRILCRKNRSKEKRASFNVILGGRPIRSAYALSIHNLTLLYLFYGIIGGIGLGIGYITPVSTLVKYFPNRPGFATGLAIMGFGFASLIAGPLMQFLVAQVGLVNNFIILGVIYLVVMGASSLYLKAPQPKTTTSNYER